MATGSQVPRSSWVTLKWYRKNEHPYYIHRNIHKYLEMLATTTPTSNEVDIYVDKAEWKKYFWLSCYRTIVLARSYLHAESMSMKIRPVSQELFWNRKEISHNLWTWKYGELSTFDTNFRVLVMSACVFFLFFSFLIIACSWLVHGSYLGQMMRLCYKHFNQSFPFMTSAACQAAYSWWIREWSDLPDTSPSKAEEGHEVALAAGS